MKNRDTIISDINNLIQKREYLKANTILDDFNKNNSFKNGNNVLFLIAKLKILNGIQKYIESLKLLKQIEEILNDKKERTKYNKEINKIDRQIVEILLIKIASLYRVGKNKEGLVVIEKTIQKVKKPYLFDKSEKINKLNLIKFEKARLKWQTGDFIDSLDIFMKILDYFKSIDNKDKISHIYTGIGLVKAETGNLNAALTYLFKSIKIQITVNDLPGLSRNYNNIGWIYRLLGHLDRAIEFLKIGVRINEKLNTPLKSRYLFGNIGYVLKIQGKLEESYKYFEESLKMGDEIGNKYEISLFLFDIFNLSLERGMIDKARFYLQRFKLIAEGTKNQKILTRYELAKALIYKKSTQPVIRMKAKEILSSLSEEKHEYELLILILINLCDILIKDLKIYHNESLLQKINKLSEKILKIAEKQQSFILIIQSYLLIVQLKILNYEFKSAKKLLIKAQDIAEKQNLTQLAIKVSEEHDKFLVDIADYEYFEKEKKTIEERLEKVNLGTQIDQMLHQGRINYDKEIKSDDPIFIGILDENGPLIFSNNFKKGINFDKQLLSGLFSAFSTISDVVFDQTFERAKFGAYTVLLKKISPIQIIYIFKGQSYFASQKFSKFINRIKSDNIIWEEFSNIIERTKIMDSETRSKITTIVDKIFDTSISIEVKKQFFTRNLLSK